MLLKLVWIVTIAFASIDARLLNCIKILYGGKPTYNVVFDDGSALLNVQLEIKYDTNQVIMREDGTTGIAQVLVNSTEIMYKGSAAPYPNDPHERHYYFDGPLTIQTAIVGTSRLVEKSINSQNYKGLSDCELHLHKPMKIIHRGDFTPDRVINGIMLLATNCINAKSVCDQLYPTNPENSEMISTSAVTKKIITQSEMLRTNNVDYHSGYMALWTYLGQSDINTLKMIGLQSTINILVDLAIAEIVSKIREESNGVIKIPDISERFAEGHSWTLKGEFDAINGLFSDLTTLSRNGDAKLSHDGLKFVASCGFGLTKAHIDYEKYKLKYGISVSGKLSADVDGVSISISTAVDYNHKPCRVVLQDLRVTEMGKLDVHVTGLSPLNKMVSRLITWITNKWENDVVHIIESRIKGIVQEHLDTYDCERFRP